MPGDIKDQIQYLVETKNMIRKAIIEKDVSVPKDTPFRDYAQKIKDIPASSNITVSELEVTENKEYDAGEGKAYNPVTVNVQPKLKDLDITNDGTYKVKDDQEEDPDLYGYENVTVDTSKHLMEKEITSEDFPETPEAITFVAKDEVPDEDEDDPDKAVYGYSKFKIDVSGKLGEMTPIEIDAQNYGEERVYYASEDNLYGYSKVTVRVVESQGPFDVEFRNGNDLLQTVHDVPRNGNAVYTGAVPESKKEGEYFTGWNPQPFNIIKNTECYAQFKKGKTETSSAGEIDSTWAEIGSSGGADLDIGTWKYLYVNSFDYEGVTIPGVSLKMVKVAANEDGTTSSWLSEGVLPLYGRFYENEETRMVSNMNGWDNSKLKEFLNNDFYQAVFAAGTPISDNYNLGQYIKSVRKHTHAFSLSVSGNDLTTGMRNFVSDDNKIWVPSAYELGYDGYESFGKRYEDRHATNITTLGYALRTNYSGKAWWVYKETGEDKPRKIVNSDDLQPASAVSNIPAFNGNTIGNTILTECSMNNADYINVTVTSAGDGGSAFWYVHQNMADIPQRVHTSDPGDTIMHSIRIGFCT